MVTIGSLWVPILLSGVAVFAVSSALHMVLTYHWSDFGRLPAEDDVRRQLRGYSIPPGEYIVPHAGTPEVMRSPDHAAKLNEGPVLFMTVYPNGPPAMGTNLALWFGYSVLISLFSAYVAGRVLEPGADYLAVFRVVGTVAFMAYALGLWQNSIWYRRKWSTTLRTSIDGLIYALVTAGVFGWQWPR